MVDTRERYGYRFAGKPVRTVRRALSCGDYAVCAGPTGQAKVIAAVERKSLPDLATSLTGGRLRFALGELATLPRAALVVEDRYSQIFKLDRVRPATVADALAELQIRAPRCSARHKLEALTWAAMADQPGRDVRLHATDAAELVELLTFLGDWLAGPDTQLLADSFTGFVGHPGYDLPALQADLARFAFLLGDDGERAFGPQHP